MEPPSTMVINGILIWLLLIFSFAWNFIYTNSYVVKNLIRVCVCTIMKYVSIFFLYCNFVYNLRMLKYYIFMYTIYTFTIFKYAQKHYVY